MESKNPKKVKIANQQLDLFSLQQRTDLSFNSVERASTNSGLVINIFDYTPKQQVSKFYEEVKRLTSHLD